MPGQKSAMPAAAADMLLPFSLPSICKKKVTAAFDGGLIRSDGGVLLLAGADKQLGLTDALAAIIPDRCDPAQITHSMADILRARIFAIACGYPDADDLDDLRKDPAFKLACGRLPESGDDLASQPTMSRWENAPDLRTLIRLTRAPGGPVVQELPARAQGHHPRYRRHCRYRAWPSAVVSLQRPLR
jgi:Transposase DDE domain group 1